MEFDYSGRELKIDGVSVEVADPTVHSDPMSGGGYLGGSLVSTNGWLYNNYPWVTAGRMWYRTVRFNKPVRSCGWATIYPSLRAVTSIWYSVTPGVCRSIIQHHQSYYSNNNFVNMRRQNYYNANNDNHILERIWYYRVISGTTNTDYYYTETDFLTVPSVG